MSVSESRGNYATMLAVFWTWNDLWVRGEVLQKQPDIWEGLYDALGQEVISRMIEK